MIRSSLLVQETCLYLQFSFQRKSLERISNRNSQIWIRDNPPINNIIHCSAFPNRLKLTLLTIHLVYISIDVIRNSQFIDIVFKYRNCKESIIEWIIMLLVYQTLIPWPLNRSDKFSWILHKISYSFIYTRGYNLFFISDDIA